jgi:hypothetical protein
VSYHGSRAQLNVGQCRMPFVTGKHVDQLYSWFHLAMGCFREVDSCACQVVGSNLIRPLFRPFQGGKFLAVDIVKF